MRGISTIDESLRRAFLKRKRGERLTDEELAAERAYQRERRRRRIEVYLPSQEEVRRVKQSARALGFSHASEWIVHLIESHYRESDTLRIQLSECLMRVERAELRAQILQKRLELSSRIADDPLDRAG